MEGSPVPGKPQEKQAGAVLVIGVLLDDLRGAHGLFDLSVRMPRRSMRAVACREIS